MVVQGLLRPFFLRRKWCEYCLDGRQFLPKPGYFLLLRGIGIFFLDQILTAHFPGRFLFFEIGIRRMGFQVFRGFPGVLLQGRPFGFFPAEPQIEFFQLFLFGGQVLFGLCQRGFFFRQERIQFPDLLKQCRFDGLLVVFLLATVAALGVDKLDSNYLFMVPFPLVALWLVAFFPNRVVIPVYIVTLLPLLVFAHSGSELFVMSLLAGLAAVYAFSFFNRGWEQFLVSLFIFVSLFISYCGFRGIDALNGSFAQHVLFLFISSLLSVVGYSLIFLFEKMFNLVSTSRLQELCDTDNPLLSELEEKAPGTYQHSLQVMAMADAAARSIGANSLLVRAGALYHDVGKMVNPPCFIENETLVPESQRGDYHKDLSPQESARDIINHVSDGMEIAARYKLPHVVRDFIITHHGTSRMNYFYNKYVNEGGDPAQVADFLYDGRKPVTKEQVVLMLCDGVEAASRTLKSNTPEAYSQLVETIASQKTSEGQLDEADISLKELGVVKETIKTYLAQLYHERVPYPKRRVR